jgi:hypothetical protein
MIPMIPTFPVAYAIVSRARGDSHAHLDQLPNTHPRGSRPRFPSEPYGAGLSRVAIGRKVWSIGSTLMLVGLAI